MKKTVLAKLESMMMAKIQFLSFKNKMKWGKRDKHNFC
jgi:hypothetical protein